MLQQDAGVEHAQPRRIGGDRVQVHFPDFRATRGQLGYPDQQFHDRLAVDRGCAAHAVKQRSAAQLREHRARLALIDRRDPDRGVLEHFNEHSAQTNHHHRTELGIARDACEQFQSRRRHGLHRDAFESRVGSLLREICANPREGLAHFELRSQAQRDAADVALVRDIGRKHLEHDREAAPLGRRRGFVGAAGRLGHLGCDADRFEDPLRFDFRKRTAAFGRGARDGFVDDFCVHNFRLISESLG